MWTQWAPSVVRLKAPSRKGHAMHTVSREPPGGLLCGALRSNETNNTQFLNARCIGGYERRKVVKPLGWCRLQNGLSITTPAIGTAGGI
jgi:hypothetical protein